PPLRACGRPHATATALANVLRNARVHAPGAAVAVAVRRRVDRVEIVVDDAGAGIPAARRSVVLLPDVRDAAPGVPGQGLGLASAAAAMSAQSGALTLADSPAGGL